MRDLEKLSTQEIEKMSRDLHFNLREDLNTLRQESLQEAEETTETTMLRKQAASKMRQLSELHAYFFLKNKLGIKILIFPQKII